MLTEALQGRPDLASRVESQADVVAEEIDLKTATAQWDFRQDERGRGLLVLHVRDPSGAEAQSEFAPAEMANERRLRDRLSELLEAALHVNRWRTRVRDLFEQVRVWVQQHEVGVLFHEDKTTLTEQRSGPYEIPVLYINSGSRSATLEPIACWIVGADGRVDLTGVGGREVLVLDEVGGWYWVTDNQLGRLQPLTEELFLQLLEAVWK